MSATTHKTAAKGRSYSALPGSPPLRFTLRGLFGLMAVAGVFCALARSLIQGDSTVLLGVGVFCYGGIIAIPCFAFIGSLMVLTTSTTRGQRAGEVFAAAISTAVWIGFIAAAMRPWPQMCVVESVAVLGVVVWLLRISRQTEPGPSPEATLARLSSAKKDCQQRDAAMRNRESRTVQR